MLSNLGTWLKVLWAQDGPEGWSIEELCTYVLSFVRVFKEIFLFILEGKSLCIRLLIGGTHWMERDWMKGAYVLLYAILQPYWILITFIYTI